MKLGHCFGVIEWRAFAAAYLVILLQKWTSFRNLWEIELESAAIFVFLKWESPHDC